MTTPMIFLIDRLLVWDTGMYMFDLNRHYNRRNNWPIVATIDIRPQCLIPMADLSKI